MASEKPQCVAFQGIARLNVLLIPYCQPTNRLLNQYAKLGSPIFPGKIAGGLKNLKELFQPVYNAFYSHQMTEDRFHNDKSSWKVFEYQGQSW